MDKHPAFHAPCLSDEAFIERAAMPFVLNTRARSKQLGERPQGAAFVGRDRELLFFDEQILKPAQPVFNIVSVFGQGGVGKSTLLRELDRLFGSGSGGAEKCLLAYADTRNASPVDVLRTLASKLEMRGSFDKALEIFEGERKRQRQKFEQAQETFGRKTTALLAEVAGSAIPGAGPIVSKGLEKISDLVWDEAVYAQGKKDAARANNPLHSLTRAFVTELNKLAGRKPRHGRESEAGQRIVLCLDTFEEAVESLPSWLLDEFLQQEIDGNVVLVVAGRDPLTRSSADAPTRWLDYIDTGVLHQIEVAPFTTEESREFLKSAGVSDARKISDIIGIATGLPLFLRMLTIERSFNLDPTKDIVQNFLRHIPRSDTQMRRRLVLEASIFSRPFNYDDIAALGSTNHAQKDESYDWLTSQPFVRRLRNGKYEYHEVARQVFERYLFSHSPETCCALRRASIAHWKTALDALGDVDDLSATDRASWIELAAATVHQILGLPDRDVYADAVDLSILACGRLTRDVSEAIHDLLLRLQSAPPVGMSQVARDIASWLITYESYSTDEAAWETAATSLLQVLTRLRLRPTSGRDAVGIAGSRV